MPDEPYKDSRPGLIAFGVLHILFGCLSLLLLFATAAAAEVLARRAAASAAQFNLAQTLLFYGLASFYFIATGIGSIRARRWARALAAAVSGLWTVGGIFLLALFHIVLPYASVTIPPSQETAVRVSSTIFIITPSE